MAEATARKTVKKKLKETPRYAIRETAFINHRFIMASESSPVMIETVSNPNVKWQPMNDAARDMLEKLKERHEKALPKEGEGGVPHSAAHLAVRQLKRTIAQYDGVPLDEEDEELAEVEPQDALAAGIVVRQPKDAVQALREASTLRTDGNPIAEQKPLTGEPPLEEPTANPEEVEAPAEPAPTPEQQEEEARPDELPQADDSDTLSGAQRMMARKKK